MGTSQAVLLALRVRGEALNLFRLLIPMYLK